MRFYLLILSMCFLFRKTYAQNNTKDQLGTWYMYNGSHKVSKKLTLKTSFHVRYYEFITEYQQEIYRVGVNYAFNKKINLTLGSVYSIKDISYKENLPDLYEYRFYQDLNMKDNWGNFKVKHRIRLAQRFKRQNFTNKTTHRIRYGLFVKYPLNNKLTTYAFNEFFIKFASKPFGENRTGFGFLHQLNSTLKLNFGYQQIKLPNQIQKRLLLGIVINTNHFKKLT